MEEWRDVPGFNGKYQIDISTKEGRCRSLRYNKTGLAKELTNNINHEGRIYWHLSKNGKAFNKQSAYWIALTYPELVQNEYFEGAEIDHIIPLSAGGTNHPSNLRWVTHKGNMNNPLTKEHMSDIYKGDKAYWYGKHLSAETREKLSEAHKGKKASVETRKKISDKKKGFRHTEEAKRKMSNAQINHPSRSKSVIQYDLNGNYIATYPSVREVIRLNPEMNFIPMDISLCCRGKRKTHKGFIWKYAG